MKFSCLRKNHVAFHQNNFSLLLICVKQIFRNEMNKSTISFFKMLLLRYSKKHFRFWWEIDREPTRTFFECYRFSDLIWILWILGGNFCDRITWFEGILEKFMIGCNSESPGALLNREHKEDRANVEHF